MQLIKNGLLFGIILILIVSCGSLGTTNVSASAGLSASPSSLNFGLLSVNTSGSATITLTNGGHRTVTILQASTSLTEFTITGPSLPTAVAAGGSATFQVTFRPDSAKTFLGSLSFHLDRTSGGMKTIAVQGTGAASTTSSSPTSTSPQVAVSPTTVTFTGNVGSSQSQSVTIISNGTAALSITQANVTGSGFSISGLTLPLNLSPGQSGSFAVKFAPTAAGSVTGSVSLVSNASGSPTQIALTGNGVQATNITGVTISPTNASVQAGQTIQFSDTVQGTTSNTSVSWTASAGNITSGGLFTAPSTASTVTVTATSAADTTKKASTAVTVTAPPTSAAPTPSFTMMSEMYGDAGATAQQRMSQGLLTGATFHPTLTASESQFLTGNTPAPAFAYFAVPASANVSSCYPSSTDSNAGTLLTSYTQQIGSKVWDLGMPEFDQGGGCWANGRPSMAGLSDSTAYSTWTNYYLNTKQLSPYLSQTAQQRGYKWMTVSSFAFSTPYAFDMGADAALLERNEDEMSGITPGLAILRGTAFQHGGKDWGIDLSTWRYWNNGPTVYSNGRLVTGWSTATFKRNMYIAYMGGANILHNEAADYTTGAVSGSSLNPLGQTVQAFYNFAITRHPNRGTPFVPMALMQEHDSGFEPKFGEWMQGNSKWYWQNGYTQGDTMFANLLSLVYPNYNTWGTLPSGAPKVLNAGGSINVSATQTAYQQALANSADPRPWEPFGNSAWGETFDIITNQASLAAMQRYRAIVLSTGVAMSDSFLSTLTQYVNGGGILMLNAKQMSANSETLAGVNLTSTKGSSSSETWIPDGSFLSESSYDYAVVTPTTASVVAETAGNPIVTKNVYGSGTVYVTTPDFLANANNTAILNVGQKLISMLQAQCAVVTVSGPKLEYLISTDTGKTIVTLVNTDITGATWNGTLSFPQPSGSYSVQEWTSDTLVGSSLQNGQVVVNASVPAFDVRIYVLSAP